MKYSDRKTKHKINKTNRHYKMAIKYQIQLQQRNINKYIYSKIKYWTVIYGNTIITNLRKLQSTINISLRAINGIFKSTLINNILMEKKNIIKEIIDKEMKILSIKLKECIIKKI